MQALRNFYERARNNLIRAAMIAEVVLAAALPAWAQNSPPDAQAPGAGPKSDSAGATTAANGELMIGPYGPIPLSALSEARERPLFSPSRRPPRPVAAPPVAAAPVPPPPKPAEPDHPRLTLIGTIIGQQESIGIFLDQVSQAVVRLRVGQDHAGWLLHSIGEREATFKKDQRQEIVAMPKEGAGGQGGFSLPAQSAAAPSGAWRDGDGQLISPPRSRSAH